MLQLVQVVTADGIRLDGVLEGALETPSAQLAADQPSLAVVDAWLLLHGTGSNFYSGALLGGLATRLAGGGATVLRVNTRGHDQVSAAYTPRGPRWIGAAFERVADSPLDIAAWIKLLIERGHQRIGILGHSLGAVKAIYALNQFHGGNQVDSPEQQAEPADLTPLRNVVALAAVSPPRLSYSHYAASIRSSVFLPIFERAAALVAAGQSDTLLEVNFPLRYIVSAGAYVDRYGPPERYNVLNLLGAPPVPHAGQLRFARTAIRRRVCRHARGDRTGPAIKRRRNESPHGCKWQSSPAPTIFTRPPRTAYWPAWSVGCENYRRRADFPADFQACVPGPAWQGTAQGESRAGQLFSPRGSGIFHGIDSRPLFPAHLAVLAQHAYAHGSPSQEFS